jgi:hypothetical protein
MSARRPLAPFGRAAIAVTLAVAASMTVPAGGVAAQPAPRSLPSAAPGATSPVMAASTAGSSTTDQHVVARRANPDGTTSVSIYRAAPDVSAEQLYAKLKAQGVTGLVDPSAPQPLDVFQCYYGTAYALESGKCPAIKWRWNGFSDPQVYFRDHTPARWPVSASVSKWHEAVGIDSYWISGGSSCPGSGKHCVNVYSANYGATGWKGSTSYQYDSSRYFIDGTVKVQLNDYYSSTADNRGTTCHELGHALGVGHNTSTSSCMYSTSISGTDPMYPNSSDYNLLRYVIYP